jgi:hypothetical protein
MKIKSGATQKQLRLKDLGFETVLYWIGLNVPIQGNSNANKLMH